MQSENTNRDCSEKLQGNSLAGWRKCFVAVFLLLQALFASSLVEASIVTPISATASSEFAGREAINTIDSTGLVAGLHNFNADDMWMSSSADAAAGTATITWDLGAIYELGGFHLWNFNEGSSSPLSTRGVASATIDVADNAAFTLNLQSFPGRTFAQAPATNGYAGEDYSLNATGRFVRFANMTHFPYPVGQADQTDYVGVSEIRFNITIPEPTTFALAALGLLSLGMRRSRERD